MSASDSAGHFDTQVLVVGAGPVGVTLALDLASRGVAVTAAEIRHRGEPPSPKCNHISARSMEIFRRLGVVKEIRNAGLPADYPNDISYRTTTTGIELSRIPIPSREKRYTATEGPDTWWPTPEPPHRANQIYLEPLLLAHAMAQTHVRILHRSQLEGSAKTDDGVLATIRDLDSDDTFRIACRYLVGCDGGKSMVRKK